MFTRLSVAKNYLRPESVPLIWPHILLSIFNNQEKEMTHLSRFLCSVYYLFLGRVYLHNCFGGTNPNIHQSFTLHENGELRVKTDRKYYCLAEIDRNVVSMSYCCMYRFLIICFIIFILLLLRKVQANDFLCGLKNLFWFSSFIINTILAFVNHFCETI